MDGHLVDFLVTSYVNGSVVRWVTVCDDSGGRSCSVTETSKQAENYASAGIAGPEKGLGMLNCHCCSSPLRIAQAPNEWYMIV